MTRSDRPVFIVGPPRCGTTLLAKLLGSSPSFFVPGETHFMEDIYSRFRELGAIGSEERRQSLLRRLSTIYERYNEPSDQQRLNGLLQSKDFQETLVSEASDWAETYSIFMRIQSEPAGRSRWANHAPKDVFYVQELIEAFPHGQFIFAIRDPRDFLCSYKYKWRATSEVNENRIRSLYHPIITSSIWRASARKIRSELMSIPDQHAMILRYEDLVSNPAKFLAKVYEFLDEQFNDSFLNVGFSNSSHGISTSGISSSSVGNWKSELRDDEVWWSERINRLDMEYFGYEQSGTKGNLFSRARHAANMPVALYTGLKNNQNHIGPIVPYIWRRLRNII